VIPKPSTQNATPPKRKAPPTPYKPLNAFGTSSYVDELEKQDHPAGKKASKKSKAAKLAEMRSGKWLNPPHKLKDYLAYDSGVV